MFAIRVPFAVVAGTLFSVALFLALVAARRRAVRRAAGNHRRRYRLHAAAACETPIENKRDPQGRAHAAAQRSSSSTARAGRPRRQRRQRSWISARPQLAIERPRTGRIAERHRPRRAAARARESRLSAARDRRRPRAGCKCSSPSRRPAVFATPSSLPPSRGALFDEAALKAIARWRYNPRVGRRRRRARRPANHHPFRARKLRPIKPLDRTGEYTEFGSIVVAMAQTNPPFLNRRARAARAPNAERPRNVRLRDRESDAPRDRRGHRLRRRRRLSRAALARGERRAQSAPQEP